MIGKKSFKKKRIGSSQQKSMVSKATIAKTILVIVGILFIVRLGSLAYSHAKLRFSGVSENAVSTLSKEIGQEMKIDENGNINILLLGIGGISHRHGGMLADSIIFASWNLESGSITMISIPRDLYIQRGGFTNRINSLMMYGYGQHKDINKGASMMKDKIEEIVGMEIPYYLVIDFEGFVEFIDSMGGLEIFIPETIHDTKYPNDNLKGYQTFHIDRGEQIIDGKVALKYARSRHSTSDFDRSSRQQEILFAVKNQILNQRLNIKRIKKLYGSYQNMVYTNISLDNMLRAYDGSKNIEQINLFGLTVDCNYKSYLITNAGCFLYHPDKESVGGKSIILPMGATINNISFYNHIQGFVSFLSDNNMFLGEGARIIIKNGIDKSFANSQGKSISGWANKFAVKLKKYGFNIIDITNSEEKLETTHIYVGTGNFNETIEALSFFGIDNPTILSGQILEEGDIEIVLGNDFIQQIVDEGFDYNL